MLAGDFTTFASAACQGRDVALRGGVREQSHQPIGVQPGGVEYGEASADDHRSLRPDHLQPAERQQGRRRAGPRRLPAQRQSFDLRPLHVQVREEAAAVQDVGERADDDRARGRQPVSGGGRGRHDCVRVQRGAVVPRDVQPDAGQPQHRRSGSRRTTLARTSTATAPAKCPSA